MTLSTSNISTSSTSTICPVQLLTTTTTTTHSGERDRHWSSNSGLWNHQVNARELPIFFFFYIVTSLCDSRDTNHYDLVLSCLASASG